MSKRITGLKGGCLMKKLTGSTGKRTAMNLTAIMIEFEVIM